MDMCDDATSRTVLIPTPDGEADAFFAAPQSGKHPGVIMWPDIAGVRPAFMTMATRLAGEGYAVLLVNHYYRSSRFPILDTFTEWRTEAGRAKVGPMKNALTPEAITKDAAAFVAWLDQQPEVDGNRKLASSGYCMTGSYALRSAAAAPDRIAVVASFHGSGLVTGEPTSPHLLISKLHASALVCIAQNDDERDPDAKQALRRAAEAAQLSAEIDVYPAQHGWCVTDSPVYDEPPAERAWSRLLATCERYL
jgi:carboxymethylenebutenolidase